MNDMDKSTFGELLVALRKQRGMCQQELATKLDIHRNTVSKWERGMCLPESKTMVLELARQLHLNTYDVQRLLEASLTTISPRWHVPYQRNPLFTGREKVLQQIHDVLTYEHTTTLSRSYALSGLGGIGKTQIALEYAYRYGNEYTAVFWISAETSASILSSCLAIAEVLHLPEQQGQDQKKVIAAIKRWLTTHNNWLVIVDNMEDPFCVKAILPAARSGSLLFTSRGQTLGFAAQAQHLEQMFPEEGMRFLLHRTRRLDPQTSLASLPQREKMDALEIVAALGALPLALEQAGAYIDATQCSLSDYISLFQTAPYRLLDMHEATNDHPLSVCRTFMLAFEHVEQHNPLAADLLMICAFLAPDAIPEMFFLEGAPLLGPQFETLATDPLAFSEAIKVLLTYSFIQRHATTHTITVHPLVQAVLKGHCSTAAQRIWSQRVIKAIYQLFPADERSQMASWTFCEELFPHVQRCLSLSGQWDDDEMLYLPLMSHVASYLTRRTHYRPTAIDVGSMVAN